MRWLRAAGSATLLIAAGPVQGAEPRQPTGRWVVDFDDTQCVASRNYGTRDNPLFLVLKSPPIGDVIQIGLMRIGRGGEAQQIEAEIAIDQRPPVRTSMLSFTANKQKHRAYLINLPIQDFVPARTARVISIRARGIVDERFAISAIEPLMKVMDDCVADLRKVWNVTQGDAPANVQPVRGNLQGVIRAEDYPSVAIHKGQSGTVTFALLIDEAGKVADCAIIGTSGSASLDAQSCYVVKERAKFAPATGLDGKPAKGSFVQRITWRFE